MENGTVVDTTVKGVAEKLIFWPSAYDNDTWAERALVSEEGLKKKKIDGYQAGRNLEELLEVLQSIQLDSFSSENAAEIKRAFFKGEGMTMTRKKGDGSVIIIGEAKKGGRSFEIEKRRDQSGEWKSKSPIDTLRAAALELPEQEAVLVIYSRVEELANGTWRSQQPYIRYIRAANNGFTPADIMLEPASGLR